MVLLRSECFLGRYAGAVGGGLAGGPSQNTLGPWLGKQGKEFLKAPVRSPNYKVGLLTQK